ncbi:MAG: sulfite exporter TauE/SafE family protein [Actinocatenispora sp.]
MDAFWLLVVAGALVGVSVGLTGMGGGALMTPILVLLFGVSPTAAVGSDLLASVAMKPVGALVHQRAGTVRWNLVRWLVPTAVPAAFAGVFVLHLLGSAEVLEHRVELAIGGALLLAVAGTIVRAVLDRRAGDQADTSDVRVRPVPTLLIGVVGGLLVGMTSVGSGSLITVLLMLVYPRLRARDLVGTNLVQAIPLVAAAALGHLLVGDVRLGLTGPLLLGAIPAIYVGAKLAVRVPGAALKWILAVLLLGSGLKLWGVPTDWVLVSCAGLIVAAVLFTLWSRYAARSRTDQLRRSVPELSTEN